MIAVDRVSRSYLLERSFKNAKGSICKGDFLVQLSVACGSSLTAHFPLIINTNSWVVFGEHPLAVVTVILSLFFYIVLHDVTFG